MDSSIKILIVLLITLLPLNSATDEVASSYIVLLDKSKMPLFKTAAEHEHWYSSSVTKLVHVYSNTFHGFAAQMTAAQLSEVQKMTEFLSVFSDKLLDLHTTHSPQFLRLTSSSGIWPVTNYGNGMIIGILDSGIWPESASFKDTGLGPVPKKWKGTCQSGVQFNASNCNKKLIGAKYFYKGYEALHGSIDWKTNYKSARDSYGHGTHTASIAAGSSVSGTSMFGYAGGIATGMASKARIAVYKVCWSTCKCAHSDIVAGIIQAVEDGVDVISISLGTVGSLDPNFDQDPTAIALFSASKHGIFISASAGNNGPALGTVTNVAPWITTVGASTIDRTFPAMVELGNGMAFQGQTLTSSPISQASFIPLVYLEECLPNYPNSSIVRGKIVVCELKGWDVTAGIAVSKAGGKGLIHVMPSWYGLATWPSSYMLPAITIRNANGKKIQQYISSIKNASARIKFSGTAFGLKPSPQMAPFSSRGPNSVTPDLLKPDIIAPGFDILAAWSETNSPSREAGDPRRVQYNILSGTSMACPHVSGIAALLKAAHPAWSPAAVKSAIMTSAYITDNSGKNISQTITGKPADVLAYGSGHIDPQRALSPGLVYDLGEQDYVKFLCSHHYTTAQVKIITTNSSSLCPTRLPHAEDFNYPSLTAVLKPISGMASTRFTRKVTNVGPAISTYTAEITSPKGMIIKVSPSRLVFSPYITTLSYQVQVLAPSQRSYTCLSGAALTWSNGKNHVRSPITLLFI